MLKTLWLPILAALMFINVNATPVQAAPLAPASKTEIGTNTVQVQHRHHHSRRHHHIRRHHHRHVRPHVIVVPRVHHHRHHKHHRRHHHYYYR